MKVQRGGSVGLEATGRFLGLLARTIQQLPGLQLRNHSEILTIVDWEPRGRLTLSYSTRVRYSHGASCA